MTAAACRSCDAPVVWAKTIAGKAIPLHATDDGHPRPVPDGNLQLTSLDPLIVDLVEPGTLFDNDGLRYRSHFATCPHADAWRRRR